ncbi:MAG TPA: ComF family protein [Clostridia bacterium]
MKIFRFFQKIFFPADFKCIICDKDIFSDSKYCLCNDCKLEFNDQNFCQKCGTVIDNMASFCEDCKKYKPHYNIARSVLIYEGNAQKLIRGYKYGNKKYLYKPLGEMMSDYFQKLNLNIDLIVPAPISQRRLKERGYNQSLLLAKVISQNHNIPLEINLLHKIKNTPYQARSTREERFSQVKGVFMASDDIDIKDKHILLIDDVMTTGATVDELSRLILKKGAKEVNVLVLAQPRKKIKGLY